MRIILALFFLTFKLAQAADSGTSSDKFRFGNASNTDKTLEFNIGSGSGNPRIKWNSSSSQLQYSNNGSTFSPVGSTAAGNAGDFQYNSAGVLGTTSGIGVYNGGKVGIGTTSPATTLNIIASVSADNEIRLQNNSSNSSARAVISLLEDSSEGFIAQNSSTSTGPGGPNAMFLGNLNNAPLVFITNSANRVQILGNGNVGIGTTSPQSLLSANIHNNGGTQGSSGPAVASGTASPVVAGVVHVSNTPTATTQWMRVGNVVTVSGIIPSLVVTATNAAFIISTPVPTTSPSTAQITGVCTTGPTGGYGTATGVVIGGNGSSVAYFSIPLVAGTYDITFTYTYLVN